MGKGQETSRSHRVLITACVALLAASSAVGLGRVFIGPEPSMKLAAIAIGAVLLAGITRRLPLVVSALISAAALVLVLGWTFFASTTFYGLPTLPTLRGLGRLAGLASAEMQTQIAPTVPLGGLMIVALIGVWTAAWASHSLAARAGAPLLASLPCLALFTLGDTILDEGSRPVYAVAVLASLVALLFADGLRRVEIWGPLQVWTGPSLRRGSATLRATRGARGVAASVVLVAAIAPGILPGWGQGALLNPQSSGSGTTVNPYVTLQANLRQNPAVELFEVEADRPSYWRILSLDIFDGYNWTTEDLQTAQYYGDGNVLQSPVEIEDEGSLRPLGSVAGTTTTLRQDFEILALDSPWLPMAWEPSVIFAPGEKIRYNPELSIAVAEGDPSGMTYSVESTPVAPTAAELDAAVSPNEPGESSSMPPTKYERYTKIDGYSSPSGQAWSVSSFASRATQNAPNDFRKMIALQDSLRNDFIYDEDVETPPGADPLEWFLRDSKAGYCQQFAGAMAAMARLLGYPARVAVGFLPGQEAGTDRWAVTTNEAHAWPEIWFDGIGWVPFEPTPGRDNPVALSYLSPSPFGSTTEEGLTRGGRSLGRAQSLNGLRWKGRHGGDLGITLPDASPPQPRRDLPVLPIFAILLLVVALIPPTKALRRSWKLRRGRRPRQSVLAAYSVFEEEAAEMGFARQPGETLEQHGGTLAARLPSQVDRIDRLVGAVSRAAYAPTEPGTGTVGQLRQDSRAIVKGLRGTAPLSRRAMAAFRVRRLRGF